MMTTSTSSSIPALTASKATAAGSAPSWSERTVATPDARAPGLELVGRRGAERVGRAEQHLAVLGDEHPGQLADGRGLAGAVDPDDEDDGGPAVDAARTRCDGPSSGRPGRAGPRGASARTVASSVGRRRP